MSIPTYYGATGYLMVKHADHLMSVEQLRAENERLLKLLERTVEQHVPLTELEGVPGWSRVVELVEVVSERDHLRAEVHRLSMAMGIQVIRSFSGHADQKSIDELLSAGIQVDKEEISRLRAEVAGLRTGYEAYEQVNAELKAKNERIERNRDMWKGQVERQAEELTALRKRIDDMSPFKGAPFTGPDTKCLACGGYHYGMSGLPCPNMRITAQADLPETRSGQIGAALGQGEQS